jgi:HD-GYP domain-containing protein (c-di-GMP phosphodiesterase class II)
MDIIREGAGTQFDPQIAMLFVGSEDEVRKITNAHEAALISFERLKSGEE